MWDTTRTAKKEQKKSVYLSVKSGIMCSRLSVLITQQQAGVYVVLRMNVRVGVLYWMDECLLNKRPTMMCLAEERKKREKRDNFKPTS